MAYQRERPQRPVSGRSTCLSTRRARRASRSRCAARWRGRPSGDRQHPLPLPAHLPACASRVVASAVPPSTRGSVKRGPVEDAAPPLPVSRMPPQPLPRSPPLPAAAAIMTLNTMPPTLPNDIARQLSRLGARPPPEHRTPTDSHHRHSHPHGGVLLDPLHLISRPYGLTMRKPCEKSSRLPFTKGGVTLKKNSW